MNSDLKKVGLVFNADGTTNFIDSLKSVNQSMRDNYNQFKITQAQWDNSTSSTDKLRSKLDYLNNAYNVQSQKVKILSSELVELKNAENQDQEAIRKKEKALTTAEIQLQKYQTQIKNTESQLNSMVHRNEELVKTLNSVGNTITNIGKKMSVLSGVTGGLFVASTKAAIDFESAFAGVEKTVDGTTEQMNELKQGIRDMAKEIPASTTEISSVAEAAGQLGIKTEDVLNFTRVMIDLGESTNLSADEAASSLAKLSNIMGTSSKDYSRLGATIVDLGNNFATTEADIVAMSMRIAGAGKTVGLTESEVLSLATALSSVGIEAEMGGSAISKAMIQMSTAVETNNGQLKDFAKIAGMSTKEFKKCFQEDAMGALSKFIIGLGDTENAGQSTLAMLDDLGFKEVRLRDTMLRAANASDIFNKAIDVGNNAWEDNTALVNEANKRYETLKSKLDITKNKLSDNAITLGNKMMPILEKVVDKIGVWTNKISELDDKQLENIVRIGAVVVATGPLITIFGKITSTVGGVISGISTFNDALKVAHGSMTSTKDSVNNLATIMRGLSSPIGIATTSIGLFVGAIALIVHNTKSATEEVEKDFKVMAESAKEFVDGVNTATSQLNNFSDNLFISPEEQAQLSDNMNEAQRGITEIVNLASKERRDYTDQEIEKLNQYFQTMHEISQRELEVQQQKSQTMVQMYTTELESYIGNIEEYKTLSQEKLKTMQEQRDVELQMIDESTIEQLALLNQRYGEKANMQNEAYANEYNKIIEQRDKNIEVANSEYAEMNKIIMENYTNRISSDEAFYKSVQEMHFQLQKENDTHNKKIQEIENDGMLSEMEKNSRIMQEKANHSKNLKQIYSDMYKDLDSASAEEIGVLIQLATDTKKYGGELDKQTSEIIDGIIETYNNMPSSTKEVMKNVIQPMLDEMDKAKPKLETKANAIAGSVLAALQKSFDVHSPSRKTRSIFKNVMLGAEKGLADEERNLYNQTENIANEVLKSFDDMNLPSDNVQSYNSISMGKSEAKFNEGINYTQLYTVILKALNNCKIQFDNDGFIRLIDNRIREVF